MIRRSYLEHRTATTVGALRAARAQLIAQLDASPASPAIAPLRKAADGTCQEGRQKGLQDEGAQSPTEQEGPTELEGPNEQEGPTDEELSEYCAQAREWTELSSALSEAMLADKRALYESRHLKPGRVLLLGGLIDAAEPRPFLGVFLGQCRGGGAQRAEELLRCLVLCPAASHQAAPRRIEGVPLVTPLPRFSPPAEIELSGDAEGGSSAQAGSSRWAVFMVRSAHVLAITPQQLLPPEGLPWTPLQKHVGRCVACAAMLAEIAEPGEDELVQLLPGLVLSKEHGPIQGYLEGLCRQLNEHRCARLPQLPRLVKEVESRRQLEMYLAKVEAALSAEHTAHTRADAEARMSVLVELGYIHLTLNHPYPPCPTLPHLVPPCPRLPLPTAPLPPPRYMSQHRKLKLKGRVACELRTARDELVSERQSRGGTQETDAKEKKNRRPRTPHLVLFWRPSQSFHYPLTPSPTPSPTPNPHPTPRCSTSSSRARCSRHWTWRRRRLCSRVS